METGKSLCIVPENTMSVHEYYVGPKDHDNVKDDDFIRIWYTVGCHSKLYWAFQTRPPLIVKKIYKYFMITFG